MSSCEYCEILKNTFSTEHLRTTASLVKVHRFISFRIMSKISVNRKNKGLTRKELRHRYLHWKRPRFYSGWYLPKIYDSRQKKFNVRPDLKICWFAVTGVCFFEYTRPVGNKFFFYHFEMEKMTLILIHNIFVTKKNFFRNEHQKKFMTRTFLVDPIEWRQTNIFLSLALAKKSLASPQLMLLL